MIAKRPSYPMYAQDFDMDTADWENDEIGIYLRLLNYQWMNGSLPNDTRRLAKIVRTTPKKFEKKWKKISKKFSQTELENEQILMNPKMERVRAELDKYHKKQQESGKKGAAERWKCHGDPNGDAMATPMAKECPSSSSSSSGKKEDSNESSSASAGAPNCPHQDIVNLYHQILPELRQVKIWSEDRKAWLRTRWREDPKRQTLDWWRSYFEMVRSCPHLMGSNDMNWQADLEWLVRPQNMPKVIEGRYLGKGNALSIHGQRQAQACANALEGINWDE